MKPRPKRVQSDCGLSLIEVVAALVILSFAVLGTQQLLRQSLFQTGGELERFAAQQAALNRVAELVLTGAEAGRALPQKTRLGTFDWDISVAEEAALGGVVKATVSVFREGGIRRSFVIFVSPGPRR